MTVPPKQPENFNCISYNWERMTCSWDPVQNYITTRYSLTFILAGRASRRKLYSCPSNLTLPPNTCTWDSTTNPIYRQPYEFYTFILFGENFLGNVSFMYKFHHYAHGMWILLIIYVILKIYVYDENNKKYHFCYVYYIQYI